MKWYQFKAPIVDFFATARDALHIHFGLVIFIAVAVLLRRRPRALLYAWLAVVCVEMANEALDALDWFAWNRQIHWMESAKDVANTILWPTMITLFFRGRWPKR